MRDLQKNIVPAKGQTFVPFIPPEKEGMVHAAGMTLLLGLILFITYKDIIRLFTGG